MFTSHKDYEPPLSRADKDVARSRKATFHLQWVCTFVAYFILVGIVSALLSFLPVLDFRLPFGSIGASLFAAPVCTFGGVVSGLVLPDRRGILVGTIIATAAYIVGLFSCISAISWG